MRFRKFEAPTMKEAVARVKAELGPDAMIIATRQVRKGVFGSAIEVTAQVDPEPSLEAQEPANRPSEPPPAAAASLGWIGDDDVERIVAPIRSELRTLKAQIRGSNNAHRETNSLAKELASLRDALTKIGAARQKDATSLETLISRSRIAAPSTQRIIALVGPTGAGKTTTVAKLAARAALGKRQNIAIVSVDTYRVGGEEQVRIFADLIGVPLIMVRRLEGLPAAIDDLAGYARVFIDTAGRSPRDGEAIEELSAALGKLADVETHLTMPAASSSVAIDAWVDRWRGAGLSRLLFTKLDEADDLEELVRAPARSGRPITWVTTGQRVPEDIEEADSDRLLALASGGLELAA